MMSEDREREFHLKSTKRRPPPPDEANLWSIAFKRVMDIARMSSARTGTHAPNRTTPAYKQRCAIRVTYSANKTSGQWRAHGRYIARESATHEQSRGQEGFGPAGYGIAIDSTLHQWQSTGDKRLFKLIISPEFGDRLDLRKFTRDLMTEMQRDLGTRLEWVAAEHHNTEHPHVHVALRGIDEKGRAFRLERNYLQHGIRRNAEDLATALLGYRTWHDAEEAQRREIHQKRYTSLDRILTSSGAEETSHGFVVNTAERKSKTERCALNARLLFLQKMGLAEHHDAERWLIRSDFETILRAMQRTDDRQRSLAAHAVPVSDPRLPSRVTDMATVRQLEGRVLGHGEEESSGQAYMMLEGTDHNIHFIYRNADLDAARKQGKLKRNSFVRLTSQLVDQVLRVKVLYFGNAELLLSNRDYLRNAARNLIKRGVVPSKNSIAGWLGQYDSKIAVVAKDFIIEHANHSMGRSPTYGMHEL